MTHDLFCRKEESGRQEKHVDYLRDSADSNEDDSEVEQLEVDTKTEPEQDNETVARLPNPLAAVSLPSATGNDVSSVFINAFKVAEQAKHSILEQHVKMTAEQIRESRLKKKVCYNFQKGKCRFGNKCKYSHGDDHIVANRASGDNTGGDVVRQVQPDQNTNFPPETDDDGNVIKRKRRAGVTNNLLPTKKARATLDKQRAQERPWTMHAN